jgi:hypothetical protein
MYLDVFEILPFLQKFGLTLINTYSTIFNFFTTEYNIPIFNDPISVYELMFGGGVAVFLSVTVVKWIVGIVL